MKIEKYTNDLQQYSAILTTIKYPETYKPNSKIRYLIFILMIVDFVHEYVDNKRFAITYYLDLVNLEVSYIKLTNTAKGNKIYSPKLFKSVLFIHS